MQRALPLEVDVLIVGGGPVGLAAAIELGIRDVRVLLIEQNERGGVAPRAKTTNARTRTHLRRWGIARHLADESPFGVDYPNTMLFVTRLGEGGYELARFENAFNASPERSDLYPEHAQWIPQYKLEKVLLAKARSLPSVDIRFGVKFLDAVQDEHSVHSTVEFVDDRTRVSSRYLIGADGARSSIRDLIGAKLEGRHGIARAYNIIFRAPGLAAAHGFGKAVMYWQTSSQGRSSIGPMDREDIWFFMPGVGPEVVLTPAQAADMIRDRTGIDLPYEVLSADAWYANELLADRYLKGRIVLAGDACHLHPPNGGYGLNMGIGDAVDLGWKIAATVQGWGGAGLVGSYEAERRPIHRAVIDEAIANNSAAAFAVPAEIEDDTPAGEEAREKIGALIASTRGREFRTLGTVLGLGYENSPIVCAEPGPSPPIDAETYVPTGRPGCLAPHTWLDDDQSIYDRLGLGFTLVADARADFADVEHAKDDARSLNVPLKIVQLDGIDISRLFGARLALVRPDQHVAWRGDAWTNPLPIAIGLCSPK